jgi:hypothetical protein
MYPKISVSGDQVKISFGWWNQLINAKPGGIKFDLEQVESIDSGPHILKELRGLRAPGTYAIVLIGGTFWRSTKVREFWNARRKLADQTVRINLNNHFYKSVVIQVPDLELFKSIFTKANRQGNL